MEKKKRSLNLFLINILIILLVISISGCMSAIPVNNTALAKTPGTVQEIKVTAYQPGKVVNGTITYSGKEYYSLAKGQTELIVSDSPEAKAALDKALAKVVKNVENLGQTIPADAKIVIYQKTLTILVPLDKTTLVNGEQRLELYQYFLSSVLRAVEAGLSDTANGLEDANKKLLLDLIPQLSITFYNKQADTLIFYPNGVFILNDTIIEKANRELIAEKLSQFFIK